MHFALRILPLVVARVDSTLYKKHNTAATRQMTEIATIIALGWTGTTIKFGAVRYCQDLTPCDGHFNYVQKKMPNLKYFVCELASSRDIMAIICNNLFIDNGGLSITIISLLVSIFIYSLQFLYSIFYLNPRDARR